MGDRVNVWIDQLKAVLERLIELPTLYWVLGLLIAFVLLWLFVSWIWKKRSGKSPGLTTGIILFNLFTLLILGLVIDKKLNRQDLALEALDEKMFDVQSDVGNYSYDMNRLMRAGGDTISNREFFCNVDSLKNHFNKNYRIADRKLNAATDIIIMRSKTPLFSAFIAVVDLENPSIGIELTPAVDEKYLTSTFAKAANCYLAINGEAGETKYAGSGFGKWIGNYINKGELLLEEGETNRPFLAFDKNNNPTYFPAEVKDKNLTAEKYNSIFGRFDLLVEGKRPVFENDLQYPRTLMGTSKDGRFLYLMIVDGSMPRYSNGMTYAMAQDLLSYLGAYNAMACDQGGSSCMYVEDMGGIINRPRDGHERVVYTHFGLTFRE